MTQYGINTIRRSVHAILNAQTRLASLACLFLSLSLTGCATTFRANVTSQHTWPPAGLPTTLTLPYRFAPSTEAQAGLEQQVAAFLSQQFWELKTGKEAADVPLELVPNYSHTVQESRFMEPYYYPISVPIRYSNGSIGYTTQMIYGGMRERIVQQLELRLSLDIYANNKQQANSTEEAKKPAWHGEAVSYTNPDGVNGNNQIAVATLPDLLEALFKYFPGPSGKNRQVVLKKEK